MEPWSTPLCPGFESSLVDASTSAQEKTVLNCIIVFLLRLVYSAVLSIFRIHSKALFSEVSSIIFSFLFLLALILFYYRQFIFVAVSQFSFKIKKLSFWLISLCYRNRIKLHVVFLLFLLTDSFKNVLKHFLSLRIEIRVGSFPFVHITYLIYIYWFSFICDSELCFLHFVWSHVN